MADLTITASLVKPSSKAKIKQGVSGDTIAAGSPVYQGASKTFLRSDANGAAEAQVVDGIALTGSGAGQPLLYAAEDPELDLGATVGSGAVVVLSSTVGAISDDPAATVGRRTVVLGVGIGGTKIAFKPLKGGLA